MKETFDNTIRRLFSSCFRAFPKSGSYSTSTRRHLQICHVLNPRPIFTHTHTHKLNIWWLLFPRSTLTIREPNVQETCGAHNEPQGSNATHSKTSCPKNSNTTQQPTVLSVSEACLIWRLQSGYWFRRSTRCRLSKSPFANTHFATHYHDLVWQQDNDIQTHPHTNRVWCYRWVYGWGLGQRSCLLLLCRLWFAGVPSSFASNTFISTVRITITNTHDILYHTHTHT